MQLISLRSNQTFFVDYETNKLIPQTEVILLVEKPKYSKKGSNVMRTSEIQELRFQTGTGGIREIIGMLEEAVKVSDNYEKLGGVINNAISSQK